MANEQEPVPKAVNEVQAEVNVPTDKEPAAKMANEKQPVANGKEADEKKAPRMALKTPKGTVDYTGSDVLIRERMFAAITEVFKRHGGNHLDTPVFELSDILKGKYGEDSKLIYDLKDQGGELCSLRYDLTVPFARWLSMNTDVRSMKRYQIAKVYRRDAPAVQKGRMREFYQCDFDIAGDFDSMIPDAEIMRIIAEVFKELGFPDNSYTIKLNHRKILDGVFAVCGVPEEKMRPICSAVDKLDKMSWEDVRKEMVDDKGLDPEVADRIEKYVKLKGSRELVDLLLKDEALKTSEPAVAGLKDLALMMEYLEVYGVLKNISFDMSLARGLDYYTGVIYEVITDGSAGVKVDPKAKAKKAKKPKKGKGPQLDEDDRSEDPSLGIGSIAAGGRYDNLTEKFTNNTIPCVGISFGVERIFSIIKARLESNKIVTPRRSEVDAYVMAFGPKDFKGMLKERMDVTEKLWGAGIKAEFSYKVQPKLAQQFKAAETGNASFAVILGEAELAAGKCRIKAMGLPEGHPEKDGVEVAMENLVPELKTRLAQKGGSMETLAELVQRTSI